MYHIVGAFREGRERCVCDIVGIEMTMARLHVTHNQEREIIFEDSYPKLQLIRTYVQNMS